MTVAFALVITLLTCAPAKPQTASGKRTEANPQQEPAAKADKQRAAEEAVDRLQQRFYETLDFSVLWAELYVSDEKLRRREVEAITFSYLDHADNTVSLDARERAYVALGNFWHQTSAVRFTADEKNTDEAFSKIETLYESITQRGKRFSTLQELDQDFTGKMNAMSDILRKYVARNEFDSAAYRENLGRVNETAPANPQRIREVFSPAGLKPENDIYVVSREIFHYYLIEEQGQFRLLTFLLRRRH